MAHGDSDVCGTHYTVNAPTRSTRTFLFWRKAGGKQPAFSRGTDLEKTMPLAKSDILGIPLLLSVAIHLFVILMASFMLHPTQSRRQDFLPITLVDLSPSETRPHQNIEAPTEIKAPAPAHPKVNQPRETKPLAKQELTRAIKVEPAKPERPTTPVTPKEEPVRRAEIQPAPAQQTLPPSFSWDSPGEGGSQAGAGSLFGEGDIGVVPGPGTAGGGGGTAAFGLGRGSGAPGLPAQTAPVRTGRPAKPIEFVKASYPPIALRAGLESDVALKIEVDTEGRVTKAEITKSGGAGFDEEALSAVKRSRFEPAQRDGQHVPAEFTYIYRFRLRR